MNHADLVRLLEKAVCPRESLVYPTVNVEPCDWCNARRAFLSALNSGEVVLVNPEELAAKIQAGVVDYINKFGKPIR